MKALTEIIVDLRNNRIISLDDFKDEICYDFNNDKDSNVYCAFEGYIDEMYSASEILRMNETELETIKDNFLWECVELINSYDQEIYFMKKCFIGVDTEQ